MSPANSGQLTKQFNQWVSAIFSPESEKCDMLDGKDVKCCGWLCDDAFMIVNGCVTLSGSPFDCLWFWEFGMIDESDLYQICNFRNMLLVPRNLSAIFRSRSKLLYRGTTGPCLDEMSPQRIYPLMRWTGPPLMRCPHPLMSGSPPWEKVTISLYLRHVDDIIHYPDKGKSHRIL